SSWPKPFARRPRFVPWERIHGSRPSLSSSPIARGVSPSPHVLSRGKTAASARSTSAPWVAVHAAAAAPDGPAPTTSTSVVGVSLTPLVSQYAGNVAGHGWLRSADALTAYSAPDDADDLQLPVLLGDAANDLEFACVVGAHDRPVPLRRLPDDFQLACRGLANDLEFALFPGIDDDVGGGV